MRTIRVFIASSEELYQERLEIADVISNLNHVLSPRDIEIRPVKWEYLNASMGFKHKQEEYNDALKECDICVVLYWTKFGEYTEIELNTAYQELCAGRNPKKIYVYFKDSEEISPQLKEFKESFASKYGHFYCHFTNTDTMNLNFVLQVESFINREYKEKIVSVENGSVSVDGYSIANLDNVPFASLNDEYNRLRLAQKEAQEFFIKAKEEYLTDSDNQEAENTFFTAKADKTKVETEFAEYQQTILSNALNFVRMSGESYTKRMAEAKDLFDSGRISEADELLRFDILEEETIIEKENFLQTKKNLIAKVNEWVLKVSTSLANEKNSYSERIHNADRAYENALCLAETSGYSLEDLSFLLAEQLAFLRRYSLLSGIEKNLYKQVEIERKIAALGLVKGDGLACSLYNLACEMLRQNRLEDTEQLLMESMTLQERYIDEFNGQQLPILLRRNYSGCLILMGDIKDRKGHPVDAITYYQQAQNFLLEDDSAPPWDVALIHEKKGSIYERSYKYDDAEEEYTAALNIRSDLFNLNFERIGYNSTPGLTIIGQDGDNLKIQYNPSMPLGSDFAIDLAEILMRLAYVHFYGEKGGEELALQESRSAMKAVSYIDEDEKERLRVKLMNLYADSAWIEENIGERERSTKLFGHAIAIAESLEKEQPGCFTSEYVRILGNAMLAQSNPKAIEMGEKAITILESIAEESPAVYYPRLISILYNLLSLFIEEKDNDKAIQYVYKSLDYYKAISVHCPDAHVMVMPVFYKRILPFLSEKSREDLIRQMISYYDSLKTSNESDRCKTLIYCILLLSDLYRKTQGQDAADEVYNHILPYAVNLINLKDESAEGLVPRIYTDMALDDIKLGLYNYAYEKLEYALNAYLRINNNGKFDEQIDCIKGIMANFTKTSE